MLKSRIRPSLCFILGNAFVAVACVVGGILLTRAGSPQARYGLLAFMLTFGFAESVRLAKAMTPKELAVGSAGVAILTVAAIQVVGFVWFPGVVKDVEPFSAYHLQLVASMLVAVCLTYAIVSMAGFLACAMVRRLSFRSRGSQRQRRRSGASPPPVPCQTARSPNQAGRNRGAS